jgi:hypothetical protein
MARATSVTGVDLTSLSCVAGLALACTIVAESTIVTVVFARHLTTKRARKSNITFTALLSEELRILAESMATAHDDRAGQILRGAVIDAAVFAFVAWTALANARACIACTVARAVVRAVNFAAVST